MQLPEEETYSYDPSALVRAIGTGLAPDGEPLTEDARRLSAALLANSDQFRETFGEATPETVDQIVAMSERIAADEAAGKTTEDLLADAIKAFDKDQRLELTRWTGLHGGAQFVFDGESQRVVS